MFLYFTVTPSTTFMHLERGEAKLKPSGLKSLTWPVKNF